MNINSIIYIDLQRPLWKEITLSSSVHFKYQMSSEIEILESFCLFDRLEMLDRQWLFTYMNMSPFPVKGFKFRPVLGTVAIEQWCFLACQNFCDTEQPFVWSSPRTRNKQTCCRAFEIVRISMHFNKLCLVLPGIKPQCKHYTNCGGL